MIAISTYPVRAKDDTNAVIDVTLEQVMLAIRVPVENGYRRLSSRPEMLPKPNRMPSRLGNVYQGKTKISPTPRSKRPHIRINPRRKKVFAFDTPPRIRFLLKTFENQSAIATANIWFIAAATSMINVVRGEEVKKATNTTWLTTEPKTI